jgi:hypothetical protein
LTLDGNAIAAAVPTWIATRGTIDATVRDGTAAIYEIGERPAPLDPALAATISAARLLDARAVSPWHDTLRVDLTGAAVVVSRERFDPNWQLAGDGVTVVRHLRADGYANAWLVRGTGVHTLEIVDADQAPTRVLLALSGAAFAALLLAAFACARRR